MNERPTPETDAAIHKSKKQPYRDFRARELHDFARKLERERDEAREQLKRTLDELYEEQQSHGKTKGNLTERQIERDVWCLKYSKVFSENKAMREAIKEAHAALEACMDDSGELLAERGWWRDEPRCGYQARYEETKQRIEDAEAALTKLKIFIKP